MAKNWKEVTAEEIDIIKNKKCKYCKYSGYLAGVKDNNHLICDYWEKMKRIRRCSPLECDKFIAKTRKPKARPIIRR